MTIISYVFQIEVDVTDFTWQQTLQYLLSIIHTAFTVLFSLIPGASRNHPSISNPKCLQKLE